MGYEARSQWLRGFLKVFALWAGLTSTPGLFLALNNFSSGRFSLSYLGQLVVLLGVGAVFGLIGAAAMTVGVPPGRKLVAIPAGVAFGFALPLIIFWGLAAALPKNEATMGYVLFGCIYAVPNGLAGTVAGVWRGDGKV